MAKKTKAALKVDVPPPPRSLKPAVNIAAIVILLAGVYWAIDRLGQAAGESVARREAFRVKFDDLLVPTPPGMDRTTFLTEVKYLGQPPKEFSLADSTACTAVAEAFSRHPWVLAASPGHGSAAVELVFRKPVLKVLAVDGPARLIDTQGTLLPMADWQQPIAVLATPQPPPLAPAGQRWLNPRVLRALEFVNDYSAWELRHDDRNWNFTRRDGKPYTLPMLEK